MKIESKIYPLVIQDRNGTLYENRCMCNMCFRLEIRDGFQSVMLACWRVRHLSVSPRSPTRIGQALCPWNRAFHEDSCWNTLLRCPTGLGRPANIYRIITLIPKKKGLYSENDWKDQQWLTMMRGENMRATQKREGRTQEETFLMCPLPDYRTFMRWIEIDIAASKLETWVVIKSGQVLMMRSAIFGAAVWFATFSCAVILPFMVTWCRMMIGWYRIGVTRDLQCLVRCNQICKPSYCKQELQIFSHTYADYAGSTLIACNPCWVSYHIVSIWINHIASCHVIISYHIIPYHTISYHIIPYHTISSYHFQTHIGHVVQRDSDMQAGQIPEPVLSIR